MRMYDIILKKRNNEELSDEEIAFFINEYTNGAIPDYQASALLMAIYFRGMNERETAHLTYCMAHSGDIVDLSKIKGIKVDKHSTGGVGDKTTLIVAPIVASLGVPVAKMSGRGLGHTGGTVDKLEAIPDLRTSLSKDEFLAAVEKTGLCITGQSGNLAPADKKLYALRDATATVDSIPLIAASVMSKKIAAGADKIVLDVKYGSGAFMKSPERAIELAKTMVSIGENVGKETVAIISNMDIPLGYAIGNSLEVIEAVETLKGKGPSDLVEICIALAANMLSLAGKGSAQECRVMAGNSISDGSALKSLRNMIEALGGNVRVCDDYGLFESAKIKYGVKATNSGYINSMKTDLIGVASSVLGAGRKAKDEPVDHSAGIILKAKTGDFINTGDTIAVFYTSKEELISEAEKIYLSALSLSGQKPEKTPLIYARVSSKGVENIIA